MLSHIYEGDSHPRHRGPQIRTQTLNDFLLPARAPLDIHIATVYQRREGYSEEAMKRVLGYWRRCPHPVSLALRRMMPVLRSEISRLVRRLALAWSVLEFDNFVVPRRS